MDTHIMLWRCSRDSLYRQTDECLYIKWVRVHGSLVKLNSRLLADTQ